MKNTSIRCYAGGPVVGTICLLLAAPFSGCIHEAAPPKTSAPVTVESPAPTTPDAAAHQSPAADEPTAIEQTTPAAAQTPSKDDAETVQVGACDGGKAVEVPKGLTGQALADSLMDQWKRTHPEANWVTEEKQKHALKPPADNSDLLQGAQAKGDTYGSFTQRDLLIWARETEKFVAEGSRIFHSADELGSTVAVSCDMCHPHAANTHPETYPKFQTQLGRVALLRDMINWCVENPVRGEKLDPDGPRMRALEAYIQSQRKGVPMNYGKH
jgi:thiosulfate dehydrogenase